MKTAAAISPEEPFRTPLKPRWLPPEMVNPPVLDPAVPRRTPEPRFALLLNPFYPKDPHASFGKHVLTPTLALTSIAAATPPGWRLVYWDENLLQGPPPHADALAVGDGVQLWPQILRDAERGQLQSRYVATYETDYCDDPAPRRSLLPRGSFLTSTSLIATRGCHNRCGFCYLSTDGLKMPYRMRRPEQVVREFAENGEPYAVFVDNNLGSKRDYLRSLCRALRPLEKIWSAAVTIDVTDDPSLVREMALAGCTGVFIGFESLSNDNLIDARKRTPRTEDYARRVAVLHDHGIQVNGSFVVGFDEDRPDCFATLAQWIEANRLECATFHILTPYPGTPLYRKMEGEGRILHREWSRYDTGHVVFRPKHMSAEELAQGYGWLYQRLFSDASIWRRRPADARAVLPYLAMSYLYKRSNRFWHFLIRHNLTHAVWSPLVEITRRRHLSFRARLAARPLGGASTTLTVPAVVVSAGV